MHTCNYDLHIIQCKTQYNPKNIKKQNKKYKNDAVVGKFILCVSIQQAYINCAYGWVMRVARLRININLC